MLFNVLLANQISGFSGKSLTLAGIYAFPQMLVYFFYFLLALIVLFFFLHFCKVALFYYRFGQIHLNVPNKGLLFFDAQGNLIGFNKNVSHMLNLNLKELRGKHFKTVLKHVPQLKNQVESLMLYHRNINEDLTIIRNNSILKGHLLGYPIKGLRLPMGYVVEIYDLSRDILHEREDLIHRLVRKMAHDIKTPLATIKFSVETLKYIISNIEDEEVQEDLKNINQEVNRIQAITNNYSKIAHLNKLRINIVDLAELFGELLKEFHPPERVTILQEFPEDTRLVTADADQLKVMFKELLVNALDAVGAQGEIRIRSSRASLTYNKQREAVCICVSDNGAGIPPGVKDKIFEPSFTTKTHGTGLGLVFVKQIVANHQGEILINSELQKGTNVQIIIPRDIKQ